VRPLRRIDLRAIVRLYDQNLAGQSGWPLRTEAYWEWLLSRGACDRVYVASTSSDTADFAQNLASIIGYVCIRQARIVELVTALGRDSVFRQLAERACADAREQDGWAIRHDAPPTDPLHSFFRRSGGRLIADQELGGELFMAKLLDPLATLRHVSEILTHRAAQAQLARPSELGIDLRSGDGRKTGSSGIVERFRLHLGRRNARIETGGPSKHSISFAYHDFAPLLLGDIGAEAMAKTGRLKSTSKKAQQIAATLFPGGLWWRPPLDDLLA